MAIRIGNVVKRDLQEQVEKNKQDIAKHYEIDRVLSDWGIKVLGVVNTPSDIPEGIYEYGDAYGVRTGSGIVYYVWTRANINVGQDEDYWLDIGALSIIGPTGPQGLQGPQGIQGVRGSLWVSSTTAPTSQVGNNGDQWLNTTTGDVYQKGTSTWTRTGNIKGPQGVQGPTGPQGIQGIQGPTGSQGPKGDTGSSFKIGGLLNSIDNLPVPTEANRSIGYAVARQDNTYDLYVVVGTDNLQWVNMGRVEGVEGPQGPVGPQGPAGADIQIVSITGIPSTATSGTLTQEQVQTLLAHPGNYIQFFNENFYPQDVEIEQGYIVYSHVGQIGSETKIKNINLTIATGGWVLTETSLVSAPITIVNELPEANEENFEKGKLYLHQQELKYIGERYGAGNITFDGNMQTSSVLLYSSYHNNKIYYAVPINNSASAAKFYSYSLDTKKNIERGSLSKESCIIVNGILYVYAGSYIYKYSNFDYVSSTNYTSLYSVPVEYRFNASIVTTQNKIYIIGGQTATGSSDTAVDTILKFDINAGAVTTEATLPTKLRRCSACVVGSDIYIFGGTDSSGTTLDTIYKYNTTTRTVQNLSVKLPIGIRNICSAAVGSDIYIIGGSNSSGVNLNTIYRFDTTTETLNLLPTTLDNPTWGASAVAINNEIYILGGSDSSTFSTIYKLTFGTEFVFKTISTQ